MKKNEPANKADKEAKGRVIQKKSAQGEKGLRNSDKKLLIGCGRRPLFDNISVEDSPDSLASILTTPDLSHPVNTSQKAEMIDQLHETYGNSYLQGVIQAKLKVGKPNDKYEQEADRIADQVMRMPEPKTSITGKEENGVQTKSVAEKITPVRQDSFSPAKNQSLSPGKETGDGACKCVNVSPSETCKMQVQMS